MAKILEFNRNVNDDSAIKTNMRCNCIIVVFAIAVLGYVSTKLKSAWPMVALIFVPSMSYSSKPSKSMNVEDSKEESPNE